MTSSFQMIPASGQSHVGFSHCGGWTGAEGWSVSPGRGGVGSVQGKTGDEKKNVLLIKADKSVCVENVGHYILTSIQDIFIEIKNGFTDL